MEINHNKCWLIFLLIISIHALTTLSQSNIESFNNNNDTYMSNKVIFEILIESMNDRQS
jgi:hypothetical protein